MIMIERLLSLAEELADASDGSLTVKRRAVSTAYYAVFHALAELCADQVIGNRTDAPEKEYVRVYRSLEHGALKTAFKAAPLNGVAELQRIGNRVAVLQSERIRSDYLPSRALYTRDHCRSLVEAAKSAVRSISALSERDRKSLAVHLLFKNRPL
jgi:hypothetical protein